MSDPIQSLGRHPWFNAAGEADPLLAGLWTANLLLMGGAQPWRAFMSAAEVAQDIAYHPEKFRKLEPT